MKITFSTFGGCLVKLFLKANKTIVIRRLSKSGNGDFGFSLEGGYDIDGLQPHVSKIDEFGPAAQSGLHVGDFIVSINAQVYVNIVT